MAGLLLFPNRYAGDIAMTLMGELEDDIEVQILGGEDDIEGPQVEPEHRHEAIRYPVADNVIEQLRDRYLPLRVNGIDDKAGLKAVHDARMQVRSLRVDVDKARKEMKADALAWGRKVDTEAKRLTSLLEPIEEHLTREEETVKAEIERIKRSRIDARIKALQAVSLPGMVPPEKMIDGWSDEEFEISLKVATREHEKRQEEERIRLEREAAEKAELERLRAEEQARLKAEAERQAMERAELDRQRAELAAQQQALRTQQEAAEKAEREKEQAAERARLQAEAAERARVETEARLKREAEAAIERAKVEAAERLRQEALRPDRDKLLAFADSLEAIELPSVGDVLQRLRDNIGEGREVFANWIRQQVNSK